MRFRQWKLVGHVFASTASAFCRTQVNQSQNYSTSIIPATQKSLSSVSAIFSYWRLHCYSTAARLETFFTSKRLPMSTASESVAIHHLIVMLVVSCENYCEELTSYQKLTHNLDLNPSYHGCEPATSSLIPAAPSASKLLCLSQALTARDSLGIVPLSMGKWCSIRASDFIERGQLVSLSMRQWHRLTVLTSIDDSAVMIGARSFISTGDPIKHVFRETAIPRQDIDNSSIQNIPCDS